MSSFLESLKNALTGKVAQEVETVAAQAIPAIAETVIDPAHGIAVLAQLVAGELQRLESKVNDGVSAAASSASAAASAASAAQSHASAAASAAASPAVADVQALADSVVSIINPKLQPALDAVGFLAAHFPQLRDEAQAVAKSVAQSVAGH